MSYIYRYITALAIAAVMLMPALAYTHDEARADPDPPDEDEATAGSGFTYLDRDWFVDASDDLYYGNQTILLDGNLTINGTGRLVLSNVTLIMNCTLNSTYRILVMANGALEVLDGSNITAPNASVPYFMMAMAGSNLIMADSFFRFAGKFPGSGFNIMSDNAIVERCNFTNCSRTLSLDGDNILISNVKFFNCYGYSIQGSNIENVTIQDCEMTNNTFDNANIFLISSSGRIIGNTLRSSQSAQIEIDCCYSMEIKNNTINPKSSSIWAIYVDMSHNVNISGNVLDNNEVQSKQGIYIRESYQVNISNNNIKCLQEGILLRQSTNCSVYNNTIYTRNGPALNILPYNKLKFLLHDISNTNTNYSRTIRYIKHQDDPTFPIGDDMSILVDCHNISLKNRAIPSYYDGMVLAYCSDVFLEKLTSQSVYYLKMERCWNANISQLTANNEYIRLEVWNSKHVDLYRCNLTYQAPANVGANEFDSLSGIVEKCTIRRSIFLRGGSTTVRYCTISGDLGRINLDSANSMVYYCDFTSPVNGGIYSLYLTKARNTIQSCDFANKNGGTGIRFSSGSFLNRVTDCTFSNNTWDITIQSDSNKIYDNEFSGSLANIDFNILGIESNRIFHNNFYNVSADPVWGSPGTNALDNGYGEGNYWEDYDGEDDGSNDRWPHDGVGDTKIPHHFDDYPMMNPWQWYLPHKPVIKAICPAHGYNSTGEYNVTWDYAHNATSYLFQESELDDFSVITSSLETPNTRVWVAGKTNDTYYYRVKALNQWGESPWSQVRFITVDHPPFTPAGLAAETFPDGNSISVEWQIVEGDVAGYQLHYTTDGDSEWHQVAEVLHPTNYTYHHGLVDGRNYTYRVRSLDERGTPSPWSGEVTGVPVDTVAPAMPGGLQIAAKKDDSVTLIWQPNAEADLAGYNIYRLDVTEDGGRGTRDIGGGYSLLTPEEPWQDPYYVDNAVESGRKYSYTITALDEVPNESLPAYDVLAEIPKGNRAPEIGNIQYDVEMDEDTVDEDSIDLHHWFKDPDGDDLIFSVKGAKHFEVTIFQSSGQVTLVPEPDWNGHENLTFTASDDRFKINDTVMVTVTFVNDAPVGAYILKPADGSEAEEGAAVNFSGTAEDIDVQYGDELTYSWKSNISGPQGLGKELSITTLAPGLHYITMTVTDIARVSTNTSMHLTVVPKKIIEPPDGTEDGGDGNITDGEDGDDPLPLDGGDPDGGDGGDDDKGLPGGDGGVAIVAVLVIVMALVMMVVLMGLRRKKRELERLKKEEEEAGPALEGEVAAVPGKPMKTGPVPIPKPMPKPMLKPMPALPEGPKAEELDGEWELAQEEGPSPVLRSESIMKDPFSKKRREVVEADIEEEEF